MSEKQAPNGAKGEMALTPEREAKRWLRGVRRGLALADAKRERLARMRAMAESAGVGSVAVSGGGGDPQGLSRLMDAIVDGERELQGELAALLADQRRVRQGIEALPEVACRAVLELYYLGGYPWEEVARRTGYSERNVFYLHRQGLKGMAEAGAWPETGQKKGETRERGAARRQKGAAERPETEPGYDAGGPKGPGGRMGFLGERQGTAEKGVADGQ